jgi:hypothetical protein
MAATLTSTTMKVKLPDLEQVPEAKIEFVDMDVKTRETAILIGKIAYLAKDRGDVVNWTDCAQLIKVRTRISLLSCSSSIWCLLQLSRSVSCPRCLRS